MLVFSILLFAIMIILSLTYPILVGVYVYKDSKDRDMNGILWLLLSVLVPGGFGFVVYLIIRDDHPVQDFFRCPECGAEVVPQQEKSRNSTLGKALIGVALAQTLLAVLCLIGVATTVIGTNSLIAEPHHNAYFIGSDDDFVPYDF